MAKFYNFLELNIVIFFKDYLFIFMKEWEEMGVVFKRISYSRVFATIHNCF